MDFDKLLVETGALLNGHFLLRSGLHSNRYFQAALALQHTKTAEKICTALADLFKNTEIETVISPAIGGIVVGQEVGRALGVKAIFAEKDKNDELILRRGFKIAKGEKILVAEDVVTRGGRVQQTVDLVRELGGDVVGVAVIVDRSAGNAPDFGAPMKSLLELTIETYNPNECPMCKKNLPMDKPGS
ncbi:MAG: orotate phosphoribosyltransferase [Verrucomicrobiota bacterium]|nr:orotate phosphoribosyltransferase [Verrucomicrobiota bacterium]